MKIKCLFLYFEFFELLFFFPDCLTMLDYENLDSALLDQLKRFRAEMFSSLSGANGFGNFAYPQKVAGVAVPEYLKIEDRLFFNARYHPDYDERVLFVWCKTDGRQYWAFYVKSIKAESNVELSTIESQPTLPMLLGITPEQVREQESFEVIMKYKKPLHTLGRGQIFCERVINERGFTLIPRIKKENNRQNLNALGIRMNPEDLGAILDRSGPVNETVLTHYELFYQK